MSLRSVRSSLAPAAWAALLALSCSSPTGVDGSAIVDVASVRLDPPSSTVILGADVALHAAVMDVDGNVVPNAPIVWTVRDPDIATVSSSGVVTGRAVGSTQIAASAGGRSAVAAVAVQPVPVASVTVAPTDVTVQIGRTATLTATVKDAAGNVLVGRAVEWSSSNPSVATVSAAGVVAGVAAGSATVNATINGRSGAATVTVTLAPVASVAVQPKTASLTVGQTTTLGVVVTDANGAATDRAVAWTSGNEQVATVSSSGVVTAVAVGQAVITAASEGKSDAATITVAASPVASVVVAPATSTVTTGETTALVATVQDARGVVVTDRPVSWKSSNVAVATVSATGVVTGVSPGSVTITATSETKSGAATVIVTAVPVGSVTVAPTSKSLFVGGTTTLVATVKDVNGAVVTDRAVAWSTSDPLVATVSSSGVVTALAPGSATVTATSETKSGSSAITVSPVPVAKVTVTPPTMALVVGQTSTARAVLTDANGNVLTGRVVTWTSSNALIAAVSSTGVVTGVAPGGPVFITASSEGWNGSTAVIVTAVPVGSVTLPATTTLVAGQSTTLTPVVKDANGTVVTDRTVTWSSSNPTVATVSASGLVRALITGTATITATSEGKSASTALTVTPAPVGSVTVAPFTLNLGSGSTVTLTATVKDVNGTTVTDRVVTWKSSDTTVATVSADGVLTGLVAGTATITATSEGRSGTSTVTVVPGPAASVTVTPSATSVRDGSSVQLSASAVDAQGNAITGRAFTWTSSNGSVATVSTTGRVTARRIGFVTITATLDTAKDSSQVTVTP